jgi:arylsulfatase A-like enzyme
VVVFFIDGFGRQQFDEALAEGRIPAIARHIVERGVGVETAVACLPAITYSNSVTLITGRYPGRHGIISNKWFEPSTGRYQDYCFIKTYQQVDDDYRQTPTIYEILHDRVTVSIQAAMRRGCTHTIDNWATSGINWFFDNVTGVDCLVAQRFELIAEHTSRWGRWPDLIWVYFPAVDNIGHRFGPCSDQYRKAVANVDLQIGRICEALRGIGMYDRTYLCLVSDHGVVAVEKNNVFDIARFLGDETAARVWSSGNTAPGGEGHLLGQYDYVVVTSASRWAAVYPQSGGGYPGGEEITAFARSLEEFEVRAAERGASEAGAGVLVPAWLRKAIDHPAVELVACCFRPGKVHLFAPNSHTVIVRTTDPEERHSVWPVAGGHLFAPSELPADPPDFGQSDSRAWLRASADARYPDLVPQVVAMFDSERAGNIVFFAAEGWDFSAADPAGGHGSVLPGEMCVPMLFAGPDLPPGGTIPFARTCDLMPTLLQLLGAEPVLADGSRVDIDGVNLLTCLDLNEER